MAENNNGAITVKCLMATALNTVEIREREFEALTPGEVRIKTEYSMVSTGTELHAIQGTHTKPRPFPRMTGYIAIGHIVGKGAGVDNVDIGDRVLFGNAHLEMINYPAGKCEKVPDNVKSVDAVCTTLLNISIRGVRAGNVRLGNSVAVFGQGVIGAFAMHLAKLSGGFPVIAVDPVAARRDIAVKLGADYTIDPFNENVVERIREITGGDGVDVAIEATATPRVIASLPEITAMEGRIVVLGGIHGKAEMDLYTYFQKSNQTMIGCGSEYHIDYPFHPGGKNRKAILDMLGAGMIRPESVITHRVPYTDGPEMYRMLIEEKDKAVGVQFDWAGA